MYDQVTADVIKENAELREHIRVLREALEQAIESIVDWAEYASPYFQVKHDLAGELKRLRAVLEAAK